MATRTVSRETAGFSYVNAHTRKESYKQSDHDCVQLTLRGTSIPKPRAQATIRPGTLRHPAVRAAVDELLTAAGAPSRGPDTTDDLWEEILDVCTRHQRAEAKRRGKRRTHLVAVVRKLQLKIAAMPENSSKRKKSTHNLSRYKGKLQRLDHEARRARDAQEAYEAQMAEAGQGRAAGVGRHQPRCQYLFGLIRRHLAFALLFGQ